MSLVSELNDELEGDAELLVDTVVFEIFIQSLNFISEYIETEIKEKGTIDSSSPTNELITQFAHHLFKITSKYSTTVKKEFKELK